jgi:putative endonuclease
MSYFCYMVECADGSYYTGWTTDPQRREKQHNQGRGARYTRMHCPVRLVYIEDEPDCATAMRRERVLKNLSHAQKKKLAVSTQVAGLGRINHLKPKPAMPEVSSEESA